MGQNQVVRLFASLPARQLAIIVISLPISAGHDSVD